MSIDSIVSLVVGKLCEILVQDAKLLYGVDDQVRSLQEELMMMRSFLKDMEARDEDGGDERSRTTIKQIRKIAYDAEDVIESYILEASTSADKVGGFIKRCASFKRAKVSHQVGSQIEAIKGRIVETMERWKKYVGKNRVRVDAGAGMNRTKARKPIAYPHTNEEHVVGFEEDINMLVKVLTTDDTKIQVVTIVGMGGSGKTTLARKLYNHESVVKHFDCVAWVSVSEEWVAQHVLLDLLRKASGETMRTDEAWSLQVLVEKLHQYLSERVRYLIVVDDVWAKQALEEILPALPYVNNGRKIIVTTRKREVIDFPDLKCFIHEPRRLTEAESWELFRMIAFIHREENDNSVDINGLEALGKEMLKRCEGLPMAVIALAGILGKKETLEEWEKIKKAVSSQIMEGGRGTHLYGPVNEMLALSYNDLPCELKPCFLYLAMFPEDHKIGTEQLIRLWIAEGFITSDMLHEGDTLEDVGREYLAELVNRCVVQIASRNYEGKVTSIQIHDLVRDLCIKKAKGEDFVEIFTSETPNLNARVTESRRAAIYTCDRMPLPLPTKSRHLRSLLYYSDNVVDKLSLQPIHENFRLLRVLIPEGIHTWEGSLPTGIGSLINLRYLSVKNTNISELPSSIGNLRNLLTLEYRSLNKVKYVIIPDVLWKIEGLRHVYLPCDMENGLKFHTLKYLQTLWGIEGGSWMLEELPRLSPSIRKLYITGITNNKQLEAAFQCPSVELDRLHSLRLKWHVQSKEGEVVKLENLEPIIHCQHLRKLRLFGRIEDRLGRNIQFPTCIKKLVLRETRLEAEATLAAVGKLPSLVVLGLLRDSYRGTKWTCTAGEFSQLKELCLRYLTNLKEWSIERGALPQLSKLFVGHCEKVRRLPEGLTFITTLQELQFADMADEFYNRIGLDQHGIRGEDAHLIQHIPLVQYGCRR